MKLIYTLFILSLIGFYFLDESGRSAPAPSPAAVSPSVVEIPAPTSTRSSPPTSTQAEFTQANVGQQIRGSGSVIRILSDDNSGSRHQRFIIRLASGQTLLVAHNIDLAPRIDGIAVNDRVDFYGEYEWNSQGGVVHWTHHDPAGRHTDGWLRSKGRTYQ